MTEYVGAIIHDPIDVPYLKTAGDVLHPAILRYQLGDVFRTAAYWENSDIGGASYLVVAAATGTDDGGSFIDVDGARQLQALHGDRFSVAAYGARPTPGVDNSPAFTAAIAAAGSTVNLFAPQGTTSAKVHVPPGVWEHTGFEILPNVHLSSEGYVTCTLIAAAAASPIVMHDWTILSHVSVSGGGLVTDLIDLRGARSRIMDIYGQDAQGSGIITSGVSGNTSHANILRSVQMINIGTDGIYLNPFSYDTQLEQIWLGQCRDGLRAESGAQGINNIHIWGCTFDGMVLTGASNTRVTNAYLENNGGYGLRSSNLGLIANGLDVWSNTAGGVLLENRSFSQMSSLVFRENTGAGLTLNNTSQCGITGAAFYDFGGTPAQVNSIVETGTSDYNMYSGISARGTTNEPVLTGAHSQLIGSSTNEGTSTARSVTRTFTADGVKSLFESPTDFDPHDLQTLNVGYRIRNNTTNEIAPALGPRVVATDANNVSLQFDAPPANGVVFTLVVHT